ncbi:DEAD/DEAH box helicase [Planctomicrobium sp. SH664]|uniref:preprotein translocase subunit SecA n=1 Tax=Planctomicrobium sp. SH664 TaxID=3448125 RepID=UPI003F5BB82C
MAEHTMWGKLSRWRAEAHRILRLQASLKEISGGELLRRAKGLQWRARAGEPLRGLLPEVYALGIESAWRALGMRHFPVQVMGAIALFEGNIAEMQTGEGKTLTATLPVILRAMVGKGVHVVTANDYLAKRDQEKMQAVYAPLGLSTGCVQQQMSDPDRQQAYACDITYGTASEMGFDFLRDRLKKGAGNADSLQRMIFENAEEGEVPVQRGHYFALIDEIDSILIDDARTPLIIGVMQENRPAMVSLYRWCVGAIAHLKRNEDYLFDERKRQVHLTDHGCRHITLLNKPVLLDSIDTERIYQHIEKALTAQLAFERDRDYVISEGEIAIIDEGTGRKMEGRKWQEGLHQSIEAKERLDVTEITSSAARIMIQSLYRQYEHLAGMTGTASQARSEFKRVYGLKVSVIPTNRPCIRKGLPTRVFVSQAAKYGAIVDEVIRLAAQKRAILIGTPSVDASEMLSARLKGAQIHHVVLNARYHEQEAEIVAQAGRPGRVTIATNMAGRGTDILLEDVVRENGGLHVIATEMHTSKRIDRQLVGRSARQGDPGSFQFFLSYEDELLRVMKPEARARLIRRARPDANGELSRWSARLFTKTQKSLEKLHVKQRKRQLKYEKEQKKKYRKIGLDPFLEVADS